MKKVATVTAVALALAVVTAGVAQATVDPYVEVSWATGVATNLPIPQAEDAAIWPQTIANEQTCGVWLQQDRYTQGDATDALIATGVLNGSWEDGLLLDYDYPFDSTGKPWQFVKAPDCPVEEWGPACGPIGSCGEVPTYVDEIPDPVVTVVSQCTDDYNGTFRTITITEVDGDSVWVFDDTYRDECLWVETPEPVVNPAPAATPVVAEAKFTG